MVLHLILPTLPKARDKLLIHRLTGCLSVVWEKGRGQEERKRGEGKTHVLVCLSFSKLQARHYSHATAKWCLLGEERAMKRTGFHSMVLGINGWMLTCSSQQWGTHHKWTQYPLTEHACACQATLGIALLCPIGAVGWAFELKPICHLCVRWIQLLELWVWDCLAPTFRTDTVGLWVLTYSALCVAYPPIFV